MKFIKKLYLILIIMVIFIIPFFWLKDNQVNLGGDSSRLYFYDPYRFLTNYVLYGVNPWNLGEEMVAYFMAPFTFLLQFFQFFLKTPHNIINFINAFTLLIAFLGTFGSIYVVITDLLKEKSHKCIAQVTATIGGLFYIFAPTMTNWDRALVTFNQTFLDPALFFLLYKYFQTKRSYYMAIVLLATFLFSPNFSFIGAPTFFSFYPFVFLFFFVHSFMLKKEKISLKKNVIFFILFICIQAFHLIPQIYMMLNPNTNAYQRVFAGQIFNYVDYFKQVAQGISVQNNFLGLPQYDLSYGIAFFIFPLLSILAFFGKIKTKQEKKLRQMQAILTIFFVTLLFLISAKITTLGFDFYANLFRLPGFGMFRNFDGQFVTSFFFFYGLLIGISLYSVIINLGKGKRFLLLSYISCVLLVRGWPLLNGSMLYIPVLQATNNTPAPFVVPQSLKDSLSYISSLPDDSKILTVPLTDFGYQMVAGQNSGLYIGPSFIGPETLKKDYTGYDAMDVFGITFLSSVKSQDFETVKNILAILDIHNIFWEKNSFVYEGNFPNFPYQTTKEYIPTTITGYQYLMNNLHINSEKKFSSDIQVLSLDTSKELPTIFPSSQVVYTNQAFDTPYLLEGRPLNTVILPSANYTGIIPSTTFEAQPQNPFAGLDNNMQFHVAIPEVSWQPGSLFYPLILWKENHTVSHSQGLTRFINAYLYLAKRVEEVNKWKYSLVIGHENTILQEPKIWQMNKWGEYNSWEMVLSHYYHMAQGIVAYIHQEPQQEQLSDKVIASEQFEQHRYRLLSIIDTTSFSLPDKQYLSSYINSIFDSLQSNLHINSFNLSEKIYTTHLPMGDYKVYLTKTDYTDNLTADITDNGKNFFTTFGTHGVSDEFNLSSDHDVSLTLHYTQKNLANNSSWENSGSVNVQDNENIITLHNFQDNVDSGITKEINPLPGVNQYAISFQYNTNDKKFIAKLFDKRKNFQNSLDTFDYSSRVLQSNTWRLYQTIFTIDPKTLSVFLQLSNDENKGDQSIAIKDLSIIPIVTPIVTLEKQQAPVSSLPHISFERINPTKYKVVVENATAPYVLTMLDKYSFNWKIYGPYSVQPIKKTSISYLQGIVDEGINTNVFWDKDSIKTLFAKPLADTTHFAGEGYANSWIITPQDVGNKKRYEIIIELQSQKLFYLGSIIAFIAITIVVIMLVCSLLQINKNSTLQRKHE